MPSQAEILLHFPPPVCFAIRGPDFGKGGGGVARDDVQGSIFKLRASPMGNDVDWRMPVGKQSTTALLSESIGH